jgi:oxygen-dependent protoporphyrinogen oxidase
VFHALLGGTERLIEALTDALRARGVTIETGVRVLGATASQGAVHVDVERRDGSDPTPVASTITTDDLVLCTSARTSAGVLRATSPETAAALDRITYSSVALVTFVYDRGDLPGALDASGFLVPRDAGLLLTAASVGSSKWAHWDDGRHVVLRVSAGHAGDERGVELTDHDLVAGLRADLRTTLGVTAAPFAARISRYPDGFAQYEVDHLERVDALEASLARDVPQIRVAGASYRGLGIPACVRQGREAARQLLAG